eukprot:Skav215287  [mRNA]  locus=scaffold2522:187996:188220:+ [translate_table: standard]
MSRESGWNSTLHSENEADHQSEEHHKARLLVPPQHLLPRLSLGVRGHLSSSNSAENANSHDEVQVSQGSAVGEL